MRGKMIDLPILPFSHQGGLRNELTFYPRTPSLEVQVVEGALDVQRAWFALKIEPQPVIHLEGKNIRCCTDLQHQIIRAGTVDGTVGNEEKPMLFTGQCSNEALNLNRRSIAEAIFQTRSKLLGVNILLKTKVDLRAWFCIQNIVGLILRKVLPKILANIRGSRMALYRKVTSADRIEKVKPYGKLLAKSSGVIAQNCMRVV